MAPTVTRRSAGSIPRSRKARFSERFGELDFLQQTRSGLELEVRDLGVDARLDGMTLRDGTSPFELPDQDKVARPQGHAIEARIYAEIPHLVSA
jgi:hypothetical protein